MVCRLLRLDGQEPAGRSATELRTIARQLGGLFPDQAAAAAALTAFEGRPRPRRWWSLEAERHLRERYADTPTSELAAELGRPVHQVYNKAHAMGLRKSAAYLASPAACRLRRGDQVGAATRFRPGHRPKNKGVRGWDAGGRSHATRFRRGQRGKNWVPIGSERINSDGYRDRKVAETGYGPRDWKAVHLLIWEEHRGPVPSGHAVVFRDGDKGNIRLSNLALLSRAELMARNTIHRYPVALKQTIHLAGRLRRAIRHREEKSL